MSANGTAGSAASLATASKLAEALRAGLEERPAPTAHGIPTESDAWLLPGATPALHHHAGLVGHPPVVKPGPWAGVIRCLRRALLALVRPWLAFQTRFNQLCINQLETMAILGNDNATRFGQRLSGLSREVKQCCQRLEDQNYYAAFVNRELGYMGKIAQAGLWFNPPVVVQIHEDQPRVMAITERIIEHIFVHTRLPRPPARLLDLGCAESTNALEMASLGYEVVGVDLRDLPLRHPSFQMVRADIGNLPFPDGSFDVVVSLSTIEHVGLEWYAPPPEGTTDHKVVAEVRRLLRPGGRFLLTIPFGRPAVTPVHRVYDRAMLDALVKPFRRIETAFGLRDGDTWSFSLDGERAAQADSAKRVSAVALLVLEKE